MCEELKKRRVDMCCMQDGKAKDTMFWILRDDGINCDGQEMAQDVEELESW